MTTIDLNADCGESFGPWVMGHDEAILDIVTSANIACGFHAGDPDVMAKTMAMAAERGVGIGCHPGFDDLRGFGRRQIAMPRESLCNMIRYQLGASLSMARAAGAPVRHLKLHGALSNMITNDRETARALYEAALGIDPDLVIMVLAGTPMEAAARDLGCAVACEIFADRAYADDASLISRSQSAAIIHDAGLAARRIVGMVRAGAIIAESGKRIETQIDTVCVHGDTAGAVDIARAVRAALEDAGIGVRRFAGRD
ncbi:MAG: 5-oxoprolinase subunit PxpA [Geminicoccaceae bacterium]